MNKVHKLAYTVLQQQEESVRFSVTLTETDSLRLEKLAELMGRSKSSFCSDLISAALDDFEEVIDIPEMDINICTPASQQYAEAFNAIKDKLTEGHRAMLLAHYRASDYTMTTPELAKAANYKGFGGVNLQYGRLGTMLSDYLNWAVPRHSNGSAFPTALLVKWSFKDVWYCTLHPQVIKALEVSGLAKG